MEPALEFPLFALIRTSKVAARLHTADASMARYCNAMEECAVRMNHRSDPE